MHILVASSKGGVGKSSVATQIFAPWLSVRLKRKIDYIIYDRINGTWFEQKENDFFNVVVSKTLKQFTDAVMTSQDCVVDVGGNEDCQDAIDELVNEQNIFDIFDVIVIPMKSDLDDTNCADSLGKLVKAKGRSDTKIMWVLVGAEHGEDPDDLKYRFINFFGDKAVDGYGYIKGGITGLISKYKNPCDRDYITFPQCGVDAIIKRMALPIWQIGHITREEEQNEFDKLKHKKKTPDETAKWKALGHYLFTFRKARQYCDEVLDPLFNELDEKLGGYLEQPRN